MFIQNLIMFVITGSWPKAPTAKQAADLAWARKALKDVPAKRVW